MHLIGSIRFGFVLAALVPLLVACPGCGERGAQQTATGPAPLPVRTGMVEAARPESVRLSGVVRARSEIPLSFQVAGRVQTRLVDAGHRVAAGAMLFHLDERDLLEQLRRAEAEVRAAQSEADNAVADRERLSALVARGFIGAQATDRAVMTATAALEQLAANRAALEQARNALAYAGLTAPAAGTLMDVSGEPGQVVAVGQPVAVLAADGEREIEVSLPDAMQRSQPQRCLAYLPGAETPVELTLRELAGAADPVSRTWRARYRLPAVADPALGTVVQVQFDAGVPDAGERSVPVTALDERGAGARVWLIEAGRAVPHPVSVLRLGEERAQIRTELAPGTPVITLGTHLLQTGLPVQALAR
jgi:RND family efflux transporter MFP subunit